jgi:hypothetical protein
MLPAAGCDGRSTQLIVKLHLLDQVVRRAS